ncbi:uncharacterized protein LOC129765119 [Toxorhynchites rutilus septentrionalis]|uniref:uncharacterized protein LOC129765119 n=1 Tax=Toxorhynchites rutilus septentrionalis TaxID=329112 RepID=UPI002478571A|nr:uncharacterized protein LOC129765119 [Toxorhynchites rutilus septentrionalis]
MLPRALHWNLLACLLLASALSIEGAKRRARLELPISKPADAPLEDNLATASGSEPSYDRVEPPAAVVATAPNPPAASTATQNAPAATSTETETSNSSGSSGSSENSSQMVDEYIDEDCDPDFVAFELVTGYVFSAPNKLLDSIPGTLMLTDCLEACQNNDSCASVNYETGLCVLFSSNSDKLPGALTKSQFPVFTIYAQKSCLKLRPCERAWCIDRVQGYKLIGHVKRTAQVLNRRDCLEMCLGENDFTCRSANFYQSTLSCELSDMDRITLAGSSAFQAADGSDYLENNCAEEPTKLCEFKRMSGRILKTVDSVYQDVASVDECRELCLSSPYRCHSYDYGDTGDMVCRLSHHSRATLADIQDPYLDVPEAATYELSSCYNVSIECRAGDMIAKIRTSKLFDGKVYAKGAPNSCSVDVKSSLEFELRMAYQDIDCNVRQNGLGRYLNDVVIQHHDTIVTSSDLGLAVTCQYDLTNKTVSNDVDLDVTGDIEPALSEEVVVDSPNVVMKITSRDGSDMMRTAEVGDALALRFEILDPQSPYEIFVRELVAMDGVDSSEITLIDARGCPTDHFIMGPIYKSAGSGKILLSHFDAFKFPSSEMVQFRALVTPCMPTCEPVQCDHDDFAAGELRSIVSYGRKRRSVNATQEYSLRRLRRETTHQAPQDDMLLVQSIQITDKFGFEKQQQAKPKLSSSETVFVASTDAQGICVNGLGLIVAGAVFLLGQLAIIAIWTYLWQRRRKQRQFENASMGSSVMPSPTLATSRGDSMCKLYDSGYAGRHF